MFFILDLGLASFDSILILTSILMFGLPAVHAYTTEWFSNYFYNIFPYITPVVYPVGMIAQTGSVYLTMVRSIYVPATISLAMHYHNISDKAFIHTERYKRFSSNALLEFLL